MLDALLSILVDSIGSLTFYPFLEKSEAETNLQKIRDGLSKRGAKNIEIKYLHYRRWGIRTYSVSFENQKGHNMSNRIHDSKT